MRHRSLIPDMIQILMVVKQYLELAYYCYGVAVTVGLPYIYGEPLIIIIIIITVLG